MIARVNSWMNTLGGLFGVLWRGTVWITPFKEAPD